MVTPVHLETKLYVSQTNAYEGKFLGHMNINNALTYARMYVCA